MTRATLAEVLGPALAGGYAVPGLVCLGWEDMRAFVAAAEAERAPVILQAGPGARAHTPLPILAAMMGHLAEAAEIPVVLHLDHGYTLEECRAAVEAGFTSLMFDGSRKPLSQNIDETAAVADLAHGAGISCEGEIGFVGYEGGVASDGTDPEEAARFARETGVDAMAISVGNVHLQTKRGAGLDRARIDAIAAGCNVPLVIHGGSGVPPEVRATLAAETPISKFNIGTELRMTFGRALRTALAADSEAFDRIALLSQVEAPLATATRAVIQSMGASGKAGG